MYVRDVHWPTLTMESEDSPASLSAMASPAQRLWDETRLSVYPPDSSLSWTAPHLTAIVMSQSDTQVGFLSRCNDMTVGHVREPCLILLTCCGRAATGHQAPPIALWCTTAPFVPFLVWAMQIVALSAVRRMGSGEEMSNSLPLRHRRILHFCSAVVRFRRCAAGAGVVYLPTRRR
jgi:hypothetical protein